MCQVAGLAEHRAASSFVNSVVLTSPQNLIRRTAFITGHLHLFVLSVRPCSELLYLK